mgnify:CR=1 FL=1
MKDKDKKRVIKRGLEIIPKNELDIPEMKQIKLKKINDIIKEQKNMKMINHAMK